MLAEIYQNIGHYEEQGSSKAYLDGEELWDDDEYRETQEFYDELLEESLLLSDVKEPWNEDEYIETLEFYAELLQEESLLDLRLEYDMESNIEF